MLKNKTQAVVRKIKTHVKDNKFGYYMTAVAIGAVALQQANVKSFERFLIEKNIDPLEYYNPEMLEEMNQ